jgi:hypothetical protein
LVYEVRGESALQMRLEVEPAYGLSLFVGREAEVTYQSLRRRSRQACHQRIAQVLTEHFPETAAVHEQAEAAITLSHEQGFPHCLARATILHGWNLAMQGQSEAGMAEIRGF